MQAFGLEVNRDKVGVGIAHPLFQAMPIEHPKSELSVILKIFVAIRLGLIHHDAAKVKVGPGGDEIHDGLITRKFGAANLAPFQFASDAIAGLNLTKTGQNFRAFFAWQPQAADDHVWLAGLAFMAALVAINANLGVGKRAELRLRGLGLHYGAMLNPLAHVEKANARRFNYAKSGRAGLHCANQNDRAGMGGKNHGDARLNGNQTFQ